MDLKRDNAAALYEQIADRLRSEIQSGRYEPSGKLASEAELGVRFQVSRVTVRLAIQRLVDEGSVERRQGKGTYVVGRRVRQGLDTLLGFHDALLLQGLATEMRLLTMETRAFPESLRDAMRSRRKQGLFLRRLHLIDGEPLALASTFLPAAALAVPRDYAEAHSSYAILENWMNYRIDHADLSIRAAAAHADCASSLGLAEGAPVLIMQRRTFLEDGVACEQTQFQIRQERYELTLSSSVKRA